MPYDIFISYSSQDRAWAKKLEEELRARGVNCFLDQLRLAGGEKWEPQLLASLLDSRHFLVLWSENARKSDWVSEELYRYKIRIDPKGDGQAHAGHLLYAINLEGQNATLASYQNYLDPAIQSTYQQYLTSARQSGAAPQQVNVADPAAQQAWNRWVAEIGAAARSDNPAMQMPVAVLALTTAVMQSAPPMIPEFDFVAETDMDVFLRRMGAGQMSELGARYGKSPFDWHPTGSPETIRDLLEELLSDARTGINLKLASLKQPPIQWTYLDVVAPAVNLLQQVTKPLLSGPCLIIVDPVSLFSPRMWQRYVALAPSFLNPQAAIAFLTPFGSDPPLVFLRQCLAEQGKPNLEWFHDPIPFNPAYANCAINIADKWDIRRLVLASIGRQQSSGRPSSGEHIVN